MKELWTWCLLKDISIRAQHLPGILNGVADAESREFKDRSDRKLNPALFEKIEQIWGPIEVHLFAPRLQLSAQSTYQLVVQSLCSSNRCHSSSMDQPERLCKSTMESYRPGPITDTGTTTGMNDPDYTGWIGRRNHDIQFS